MQVVHKQVQEVPGLGRAIAAARQAKNLSQRELAILLNISHGYVNKLEQEERSISLSLLRRIEEVLSVQLINFKIDGEEE